MGQIKLETVETDIGHNFTSGEGLDVSPGLIYFMLHTPLTIVPISFIPNMTCPFGSDYSLQLLYDLR